MVSKSSPRRVGQRAASGVENIPCSVSAKGTIPLHKRSSHRQRRFRTTRRALLATPQYLVERSQRKNDLTAAKQPKPLKTTTSSPSTTTKPMLALPKELSRPQNLREVSGAAIAAVDPTLAGVSPQYVRDQLEDMSPSLRLGMSGMRILGTSDQQPLVDIIMSTTGAIPPTHVLAIYNNTSRPAESSSTTLTFPTHSLVPVHSIVFAAHCANFPSFLPAPIASSSDRHTLSVQPIGIPSPETFPILTDYLYTKRTEQLLDNVLPFPAPSTLELNQLAQIPVFGAQLGRDCTPNKILTHMKLVHGLWQNAHALGVLDDGLWDTVDLAWDVLIAALAQSTGKLELSTLPLPAAVPVQ